MSAPTVPQASARSARGSKLAKMPELQLHESLKAHLDRIWAEPTYVGRLRDTQRALDLLREIQARTVMGASQEGEPWKKIGFMLGVSAQAAHSRFSGGRRITRYDPRPLQAVESPLI